MIQRVYYSILPFGVAQGLLDGMAVSQELRFIGLRKLRILKGNKTEDMQSNRIADDAD